MTFLTIKALHKDMKSKRKLSHIHVHNILRLLDGWANFPFTTSKNKAWLLVKNCTYELPRKLPNNLKLRILGNYEISEKSQSFIEFLPTAQSSFQNENFVSSSKNLLKNRNWTLPVMHYFTWKLVFVSSILWMIVVFQCKWV